MAPVVVVAVATTSLGPDAHSYTNTWQIPPLNPELQTPQWSAKGLYERQYSSGPQCEQTQSQQKSVPSGEQGFIRVELSS